MYRVTAIDLPTFQASRAEWTRLVQAMVMPSIFCTWEWVAAWLEHYGRAYTPRILFVHRDEELIAILPLALDANRRLTYAGSVDLAPDYLDLIGPPDDAAGCLDAIARFLADHADEWDTLTIGLLTRESRLAAVWTGAEGSSAQLRERSVSPFIAFGSTFEEFTQTLSSNARYNIKRRERQLLEQQGVRYGEPSNRLEGMRALFALHERRAKMKELSSSFTGEALFRFHADFAERIGEHGWLWLRTLTHQGEPIAAFYGFSIGGRLFYYQMGFEPSWERHSPGLVLLSQVMKEAFAAGHREFDFLRGDEGYKRQWTSRHRTLFSLELYNNTLKGNMLKALAASKDFLRGRRAEPSTAVAATDERSS